MNNTEPKPTNEIYDDLTADIDAVDVYAAQLPSFEQFRVVYMRMIVQLQRNARLGKWKMTDELPAALMTTTAELEALWLEKIASWADVETVMEDTIAAFIDESEKS